MDIFVFINYVLNIIFGLIAVTAGFQTTGQPALSTLSTTNVTTAGNQASTEATNHVTPTAQTLRQGNHDYTLVQDGYACARIAFRGYIEVRYRASDHLMKEASTSIPNRAPFQGHCGDNVTTIQLSWQPGNFTLKFQFKKKEHSWVLQKVESQFDLSSDIFRHPAQNGIQTVWSDPGMEYLETTLGQSYSCSGQESLDLRPSQNESKEAAVYLVQLKMRELVFQPFELGHNGSFVEGTTCPMDEDGASADSLVPMVVAILMCVVVFFILVSYAVYHKYNRRTPYVAMD